MSATPRSARLSKPGEVVAILVATAVVWAVLIAIVATLFFTVFIPAVQFGGRGEIPSDFPVYPGAHLESAFASRSAGCTTVQAAWSTGDSASRVVDFYQQQLGGDWTITDSTKSGNAIVIRFTSTSGLGREGYVSIEGVPYSSQTDVSLTLVKFGEQSSSSCHALVGVAG